MNKLRLVLPIIACVALGAIASGQMQSIKGNDQDEVVLDRETRVADAMLRPGKYLVHSEIADGKHYVHFVEETKKYEVHAEEAFGQKLLAGVGEANCVAEQMASKASLTSIYFIEEPAGVRIKKVEIKGEDHAHVF